MDTDDVNDDSVVRGISIIININNIIWLRLMIWRAGYAIKIEKKAGN